MPTDVELIKRLDRMEKALHEAASIPASSRAPASVLGGFSSGRSNEWPVEQLKKLGSSYGHVAQINHFTKRHNGRPRLTGMGPALVRLAAMSGNLDAKALARSQGMPDTYDEGSFEKEFGFTTVAKAASRGVKGLNGEVRKVALAEGSGVTGGYIVPPQFMNDLLTIAGEEGFIEPRCRVLPMASRTALWPMLDITTAQATGVSPYFGGIVAQWQPEASTINETEPAFRQGEWVAWDLVLYTVSSNQLLADNGIGLDALLTQLFAQALVWYKEFAYLRGLGAGSTMPLGVLNAPATIAVNRANGNAFGLADAANMLSKLQIRSWDDACWIMHQSVLPQLIKMQQGTTATNLAWLSPYGNGAANEGPLAMKMPRAFLNGLPIFFTEKLPQLGTKGDVMLVDWSQYVVGMRLDMQIDVSPHYLFRSNQLAWRVIARGDGKPWLNGAITDANGYTISPMIVLN